MGWASDEEVLSKFNKQKLGGEERQADCDHHQYALYLHKICIFDSSSQSFLHNNKNTPWTLDDLQHYYEDTS